ncbi:MAG: hypothetical protein WBN03_02875 [Desulfobacterales bacterium]
MKNFLILGFISLFVSLLFNSAEAVEPATTQVSKLCEVQAGGYDLDQYSSGVQQYEQAISCNLSVADASSEGNASAGFGPGIPQIGLVKANAQLDTYNGIAKANFAASVQYYFEIQQIKVVPVTPPALLPVLFSARGEGYSQRVGYGFSQSLGVVYISGFYIERFEFEAYVVDEVAYDPIDEEYLEGGFNDTKSLNLSPNYPYSVSMSASCSLWAGPVGQNADASVRCSAQVDPFIAFDQSAFDAMMGSQTFSLKDYYKFVFSGNLPSPPSPPSKTMPWIPLLLLEESLTDNDKDGYPYFSGL